MNSKKKFVTVLAGIMAAIMILSLLLSLFSSTASALTSSEIKDQINDLKDDQKELDAQIKELEESLAQNTNELKDMVARKDGIDSQVALLHMQIENVQQQVSAFNLMIADKQDELEIAQERLDQLSEKYKERIRVMEEQGDLSYWSVIFKASSFSDLLDRLNMVVEIAASDKRRLEDLKEAAAEVAEAREKLTEEKKELEGSKKELQETELLLNLKRAEADELLQAMIAKGEEYEKLLAESEEAEQELMDEIAKKEDDYDKKKYEEWLATSVPPTTTNPGGPGNVVDGITWYVPTVNFTITSKFGYRIHPIYGDWRLHKGIDMAAATNTPIYATRTGVVTVATSHWSAGNYVNINHGDGFTSIYMHMTRYVVKAGDYVSAGQLIGYVGSTGGSTGPHLHFGIAYNGTYYDPLNYIKI